MSKETLLQELKNLDATIESCEDGGENYYCDGELSHEEADERFARMIARREEIISLL
jgi:hypothetical protein